jgi:hypothetical protein
MSRFDHRQKCNFKISAAFVMVTVSLCAIYLVKTIVAKQVSRGFATTEMARHAELVELTTSVKRALAKQKAERARCLLFGGLEKTICETEAKAEENRAKTEAHIKFKKDKKTNASAEIAAANSGSDTVSRRLLLR